MAEGAALQDYTQLADLNRSTAEDAWPAPPVDGLRIRSGRVRPSLSPAVTRGVGDGTVGPAIGVWGHQTNVSRLSRRTRGQRPGKVSHVLRLSRANDRNHPAPAKRLWRDRLALSRVCLAPSGRGLFFLGKRVRIACAAF